MTQSPLVIDASVAIKWVIDEEFREQAQQLLGDTLSAHRPLAGPPLLRAEVTNILYQRRRSRDPRLHISDSDAEQALVRFLDFPVALLEPADLYPLAFAFARSHALTTTYDSLYVVLAQLLGTELWTDDQALLRAVAGAAPWVRSIRAYPVP